MKNRKEINDRLVQWIRNKVKADYADDISLVCIYGSYLNGTMNSKSDVDCYFVPKTKRGYELAVTFILDGVGYDIFPMSWERLEGIADLRTGMQPLVGDAQIIYCGDKEDAARFQALQTKLIRSLSNDTCVREIAAARCSEAGKLCASLNPDNSPSEILKTAGQIIMTLADAVAIRNHDYFHFGLKKQFEDLQYRFPGVPGDITDDYRKVIEAEDTNAAIHYANKMLRDVCTYIGIACNSHGTAEKEHRAAAQTDASALAELYQEICSTFNKIYVCCESGNHTLAFLSSVCLQQDLDDAVELGCPRYALLDDFHHQSLYKLSETALQIEKDWVQFILRNGGYINSYSSFEQFESAQ